MCKALIAIKKKAVNMFGHMDIVEYIHKGVVEPSYKIPTWADSNFAGISRNKRGESASSKTRPRHVRVLPSA